MNTLKDESLRLKNIGYASFPVKINKIPSVKWSEFRGRLPEEEEINKWFSNPSNVGLAVVTGKEYGFFVLDIEKEGLGLLDEFEIPETVSAESGGGGVHYYFNYPEFRVKSMTKILPDVDIKADGGCVTIPPSNHKTGKKYKWKNKLGDFELSDPPIWLYNILLKYFYDDLESQCESEISLDRAIEIFDEEIIPMCIDHITSNDNIEHWEKLMKRFKFKSDAKFNQKIKQSKEYSIKQLMERFGYKVRFNKIKCPFHEERTGSLHIYEKTNTWWCFGCGSGSSTIDFVMRQKKCDFMTAVDFLI